MDIYLHNSLSRKREKFTPLSLESVGLYVCGPTVYDRAHIGNARPYTVFDVFVRLLRRLYPQVTYVRNITDIDDKIMDAAKKNGEDISELTLRTTQKFHEDMAAIGNFAPDIEPRATGHVSEMISMIEDLIEKGHAYAAEGHVLFSVKTLPSYGELSGVNQDEMLSGARVEVAPYKKDPEDFVLWKPSLQDGIMPGWESPWGYGRPGWHIECSAMSSKYLGQTFDIHGGGQDLIFPHHENEIAQSKGCHHGAPLARYWVHNGILTVGGEKMSKSLGNFITVDDLLSKMPGELIRFVILSTHYRQALDWNDQAVTQAKSGLDRLYNALRGRVIQEQELSLDHPLALALAEDINTPLAISYLHELATNINKSKSEDEKNKLASELKATGFVLGLLQQDPEVWFQGDFQDDEIISLIEAREEARKRRDFTEADRLRDALLAKDIILEDSPQGALWKRKG
ncbi:Cysteine--tRNA ligase [Candidatus Bealeia paramacronuclearis]|uniref:Cysteine--tRNA ligase n=1 Tax=Candidatus Bealeia paramacronuclearis TaxID=1921001 RepID=A0ABZ2C1H1_9PROT|nr:Cysteine--tRNA ligase [Candidatus Bealeia paramacronuclearis]